MTLIPGARFAIRVRLPDGRATDVVGRVTAIDDHSVTVTRDTAARYRTVNVGTAGSAGSDDVVVERRTIVAARQIPERPVRRREIRHLELALARTFPGLQQVEIDGWWCRTGRGITKRANSAVPLRPDTALTLAVRERLHEFYGATVLLSVAPRTSALGPERGAAVDGFVHVLTRALPPGPSLPAGVRSSAPDYQAIAAQSRPAASAVDLWAETACIVDGELDFLVISSPDTPKPVGGLRVAHDHESGWGVVSGLYVLPDYRRRGIATQLLQAADHWLHTRGAQQSALEVEHGNDAALALYRGLGYQPHHDHGYLTLTSPA